jgi:hypothetical protein
MRQLGFKEAAGLFAIAFALLVLKSPDALTLPQFWAEDGAIFFEQQLYRSWPPLLTPYAGYLHTAPRLVAWISSGLDPAFIPLAYNVAAITIDALCIAFVSMRLKPWFSSWPVVLSFFILPTAGDIFGSLTNVQWFMQFALAAACFTPGSVACSKSLRMAGYIGLGIAALTGPFSLLIGAVAVVAQLAATLLRGQVGLAAALAEAGRQIQRTPTLIVVGGALLQTGILWTSKRGNDIYDHLLRDDQVFDMGLALLQTKTFYVLTVTRPFMTWHLVQLAILATALLLFLVNTLKRPNLAAVIGLMFIAAGAAQPLLAYLSSVVLQYQRWHTLTVSSRYFYLLSVSTVWVSWEFLKWRFPERLPQITSAVVIALVLLGVAEPNYFRREPLFDLHWKQHALLLDGRPLDIPVNPVPFRIKVSGGR